MRSGAVTADVLDEQDTVDFNDSDDVRVFCGDRKRRSQITGRSNISKLVDEWHIRKSGEEIRNRSLSPTIGAT
ncbi:hypothetical protein [Aporhodopirellula aestuarii]|uniref:Uncharacterized protein n=1 Tax=Aporhodopirellula aestuarii TaxID=2950107 RepID=A0ABT0UDB3_9BACT|nr:hypothetical protein [Aporhodopirellula aestuarii]MCM2374724.1 hypothetical protein [Aporhodopirellula aestuarii]